MKTLNEDQQNKKRNGTKKYYCRSNVIGEGLQRFGFLYEFIDFFTVWVTESEEQVIIWVLKP